MDAFALLVTAGVVALCIHREEVAASKCIMSASDALGSTKARSYRIGRIIVPFFTSSVPSAAFSVRFGVIKGTPDVHQPAVNDASLFVVVLPRFLANERGTGHRSRLSPLFLPYDERKAGTACQLHWDTRTCSYCQYLSIASIT
jgi:hypothetical protein